MISSHCKGKPMSIFDGRRYQLSRPTDTEQKSFWRREGSDGVFWTLEVEGPDDHILIDFDKRELLKLYQAIQQEVKDERYPL